MLAPRGRRLRQTKLDFMIFILIYVENLRQYMIFQCRWKPALIQLILIEDILEMVIYLSCTKRSFTIKENNISSSVSWILSYRNTESHPIICIMISKKFYNPWTYLFIPGDVNNLYQQKRWCSKNLWGIKLNFFIDFFVNKDVHRPQLLVYEIKIDTE